MYLKINLYINIDFTVNILSCMIKQVKHRPDHHQMSPDFFSGTNSIDGDTECLQSPATEKGVG